MVVDPFTALGVAGNIVQFVDFSTRLFYASHEISRSTSGTTKENKELSNITTHLQQLCDQLLVLPTPSGPHLDPSPEAGVLRTLANDCKAAGEELLVALRTLELNGQHKKRKWDSVRIALATVWKKGDIDAMSKRLESYKSILALHLAQHSRSYNISLSELERANKRLGTELDGKITGLKQELDLMIRQLIQNFSEQLQQRQVKYDSRVDEWLNEKGRRREPLDHTRLPSQKLSEIAVSSHEVSTDLRILQSLQFRSMKSRESRVVEAHPRTFEWVFESTFSSWLESEESMFWISGKPGSGKSTLMKFLVGNPDTIDHLRIWADRRRLITASFFFWIAGTDIQKSQEGLFRSLLYEILAKCPPLIAKVLPIRWAEAATSSSDMMEATWTHQELLGAFVQLRELNPSTMAFCFFIDGLDEYNGYHSDLMDVLRTLCSSSNIKICMSSRPWNVFESAIETYSTRRINVQDFTREDFRLYVKDHLEKRNDFQEMQRYDSRCQKLIDEIIEKAQGVFLWVFLVVRSLIEGLQNSDRIIDLQRRLRAFPSDLHEYFMHIFTSLPQIYQVQTARAFQVTLASSQPLSIFNHWFLDWEEEVEGISAGGALQAVDEPTLKKRRKEMERRLTGRCKCLLEVTEDTSQDLNFRYRVEFLHRTVADFMKTEEMQRMLLNWTGVSFDADLAICKSTIAEIETVKIKLKYLERHSPLYDLVEQLLYHAREIELRRKQSVAELLDRVALFISTQARIQEQKHTKPRVNPWGTIWARRDGILSYAIAADLHLYARHKFNENPELARDPQMWEKFLAMLQRYEDDSSLETRNLIERCVSNGADREILQNYVFKVLPRLEADDLMKGIVLKRKKKRFSLFRNLKG